MLRIDSNQNITLTRGDTLTLKLNLKDIDGEAYVPEEGDSIRFAVSDGYLGQNYYQLQIEANVPTDTLQFTIPSTETSKLEYKQYNYDVELTHSDGCVDTIISGNITITGEVK